MKLSVKKVSILLVLITYVYHNARFKNRKFLLFIYANLYSFSNIFSISNISGDRGGTVVKVLCYKSEGRWFDPRWRHWNFSLT